MSPSVGGRFLERRGERDVASKSSFGVRIMAGTANSSDGGATEYRNGLYRRYGMG